MNTDHWGRFFQAGIAESGTDLTLQYQGCTVDRRFLHHGARADDCSSQEVPSVGLKAEYSVLLK